LRARLVPPDQLVRTGGGAGDRSAAELQVVTQLGQRGAARRRLVGVAGWSTRTVAGLATNRSIRQLVVHCDI
jgi:hypothetical protein